MRLGQFGIAMFLRDWMSTQTDSMKSTCWWTKNRGNLVQRKITNFILHAPNVHSGGGLVLLKSLLSIPNLSIKLAQLDKRAQQLHLPADTLRHYIDHSVLSRLRAEWRLWRATTTSDVVLCFNGLPPLLPVRGHVVVFVQNRILFIPERPVGYPVSTKIRLSIERLWVRVMQRNANQYIVQTPSMATTVRRCLLRNIKVSMLPFMPSADRIAPEEIPASVRKFNFVYVASGEAHKNHNNLLEAWRLLADAGLKPSLALTVNPQSHPFLSGEIARYTRQYDLNIENLGQIAMSEMPCLYRSSSALIFPSKLESFGLPLIEAGQLGLPVLASELDYVRDVIQPVETFDPNSPVSIARAVRRFLDNAEPIIQLHSAEEFLAELFK